MCTMSCLHSITFAAWDCSNNSMCLYEPPQQFIIHMSSAMKVLRGNKRQWEAGSGIPSARVCPPMYAGAQLWGSSQRGVQGRAWVCRVERLQREQTLPSWCRGTGVVGARLWQNHSTGLHSWHVRFHLPLPLHNAPIYSHLPGLYIKRNNLLPLPPLGSFQL